MAKKKKFRLSIQDGSGNHIKAAYVSVLGQDYEGADLSGLTYIDQKGLQGRCFRRAILYWANFTGSDLSGCDFRESDLRGAILTDTQLVNCDFRGAKLGTDNFGGITEIDGANFEGSIYDDLTEFPSGFNPKLAGIQSR